MASPRKQTFAAPSFRGTTVEHLRQEMQEYSRRVADALDTIIGNRGLPTHRQPVDFGGHRAMHLGAPEADDDGVPASHTITMQSDGQHAPSVKQWDAKGMQLFNLAPGDHPHDAATLSQLASLADQMDLVDVTFVVIALTGKLSQERQLAIETGVTSLTDNGANATVVIGIATNGITDTKLRQGAATSVIGRSANSVGNVADIATATDGQVLRRAAGVLGFGAVDLADTDAVTGALPSANGGTGGDFAFASSTYTPGLTNVANLDASTAYECQYCRVGTTVVVSGRVDVDPTLAATATQLGIALPIASNLGAAEDCAGAAFASGIAGQGAAILGDAANNRAQMEWIAGDLTNQPMYFTFTYQVI